jgi:cytochrome oxidase Cu insertion factor (SCO1/SenC/PrrC family)
MYLRLAALVALTCALASISQAGVDPVSAKPPRVDFTPPAPGSYQLQHIQLCPDGVLLDSDARTSRLSSYTTGKITLLTFFYTYCHDPWGCPFAYQTLTGLRSKLLAEPELARRVRFVSVSFDPTHDTPAELQRYASSLKDDRLEWRFLTARSVADLMPVLDGFGQDVSVVTDEHGQPTRTVDHMLKLFLIDRHGIVREIYSLAYLQPQVMLNDIKTLALDESAGFSAVR